MSISFETQYDQKSMTAMARALRKTIRQKKNRRSHIFGWTAVVLALLLVFWSAEEGFGFCLELRSVITLLAAGILVIFLLWEDHINGYFAKKRLLPGMEKSNVIFNENEFISGNDVGVSTFGYDRIERIAEDENYFIFIFSMNHAQVYDKRKIAGGTSEEFGNFIERVTGKQIQKI